MKKKVAFTVGADKVEIEKVVLSLRNSDLFIRLFFLAHGLRVPRERKRCRFMYHTKA